MSIYASADRSHAPLASTGKCSASKTNHTATTSSPSCSVKLRKSNCCEISGPKRHCENATGKLISSINKDVENRTSQEEGLAPARSNSGGKPLFLTCSTF